MSIVKFFGTEQIRFVPHPENEYAFGIVASDMAAVLEHSDTSMMCNGIEDEWKGTSNVCTPGGNQDVLVIWEPGVYELLVKSRIKKAKPFKFWVFKEVLPSIRKTGSYGQSEPTKSALLPVTDETVKVHIQGIKYLTDNGDLKLAQLLKVQFGNRMLAEQQNLLKPVDVPQYEGVVEVAIRLGFSVPPNYEGSLGSHVAKQLKHLSPGHNQRYSGSSSTVIAANMYPVNHPEVENAVLNYCVSKSFYRRDINLLD